MMKQLMTKYGLKTAVILLGAAGGYAYYYFVGCVSGTCPITSNPYISIVYGTLLGYFVSGMIVPNTNKQTKKQNDK